jgi:SAM-dependent methyltransferase
MKCAPTNSRGSVSASEPDMSGRDGDQQPYDETFFSDNRGGSRRSARAVVPVVLEYVQPCSVLDVGCGLGTWLRVFAERGVSEILGVDGDYVRDRGLEIPPERFIAADLSRSLDVGRTLDLVVSLEVAEHLPESAADSFVGNLVRHAPIVLFSAAVPFQGGTGHLNEQWPEWWAARFATHGYVPVDCLRGRIWSHPDVEWWYAQNILFYADRSYLKSNAALRRAAEVTSAERLSLVHPKKYLQMVRKIEGPLGAFTVSEDLQGYQTYQVRGLPPGPICTPTVASIDAALVPDAESGYLYFLAIPDGDGAHAFARTLDEHNANKRLYGYE